MVCMYTVSKVSECIGIKKLIPVSYQDNRYINVTFYDTFMMILIRIGQFIFVYLHYFKNDAFMVSVPTG